VGPAKTQFAACVETVMLRTGVDAGVLTVVVKNGEAVAVAEKDVTLPVPLPGLHGCHAAPALA
jgi:hypothetical protein